MSEHDQEEQAAKLDVQRAQLRLLEIQNARRAGRAVVSAVTAGDFMLSTQVLLAGRRFAASTEQYLLLATDLPEFWVAMGCKAAMPSPIGYLRYVRCADVSEAIAGSSAATFELQQMLPASAPVPFPIVSLSGVLWSRKVPHFLAQVDAVADIGKAPESTSDAASKLLRLGVSGPYDGKVEISSCETKTALSLPVEDINLLLDALQNIERNGSTPPFQQATQYGSTISEIHGKIVDALCGMAVAGHTPTDLEGAARGLSSAVTAISVSPFARSSAPHTDQ